MSLPWINDGDLLWDTLILGADVWPGLPVVEAAASRSVDAQKKKGDDGANLVDQGYEPTQVKITIRMWLREQWEELQRLLPNVHPRTKGGIRTPVDIIHPATQLIGVRQIYVEKVGPLTVDRGLMTFVLEAIEWFPAPKPNKSSTKKAKASSGGDIPNPNSVNGPDNQGNVDLNV